MSKYHSLWEYLQKIGASEIKLTFEEIKNITGVPIDHSFLNCKKELIEFGYIVKKIYMKDQTFTFCKMD